MKKLVLRIIIIVITVGFTGCTIGQPSPKEMANYKKECNKLQQTGNFVFGRGECLNYYVVNGTKKDEINILIHGSWERGSDPLEDKYNYLADEFATKTSITSIALAMPGYSESTNNRYQDMSWRENKTVIPAEEEFIKIVSQAIQNLKNKYNAKKVNIYGHSSGAMIGGILSGYTPGLIDKYILLGGAYDIYHTYRFNNWGTKNSGLISSVDFVSEVDKNAKYLVIAGENDKKADPSFAENYVKLLKEEGIKAKVLVIKGVGHSGLEVNDEVLEASFEFLNK